MTDPNTTRTRHGLACSHGRGAECRPCYWDGRIRDLTGVRARVEARARAFVRSGDLPAASLTLAAVAAVRGALTDAGYARDRCDVEGR